MAARSRAALRLMRRRSVPGGTVGGADGQHFDCQLVGKALREGYGRLGATRHGGVDVAAVMRVEHGGIGGEGGAGGVGAGCGGKHMLAPASYDGERCGEYEAAGTVDYPRSKVGAGQGEGSSRGERFAEGADHHVDLSGPLSGGGHEAEPRGPSTPMAWASST